MSVPKFEGIFPSESQMSPQQKRFYRKLERKLSSGEYVDIEGNISYVFVYIYKVISSWRKRGLSSLSDHLIYLSEIYFHEEKIAFYCLHWSWDCLLAKKKYKDYLLKTELESVTSIRAHKANIRINISKKIGVDASPVDLIAIANFRKNKFIVENEGIYKEKLEKIFYDSFSKNGKLIDFIEKNTKDKREFDHRLFQGSPIQDSPYLEFKLRSYYTCASKISPIMKSLLKEAENEAREEIGLPRIGEGWIAETNLYLKIRDYFSSTLVVQHGQPHWLGRQHFDIWIPNWNIAIEYHGIQHFEPVDFFGGMETYLDTVERDKRKLKIAKKNGVSLFVVREGYDESELIKKIETVMSKRPIPTIDL